MERSARDAHLALRDVQKLEIDGTGVTLLIGDFFNLPGISLYNCKDVTLKGITIDAATPVFSQGKVTKIAEDHSFYEMEMDPAYLLDMTLVRSNSASKTKSPSFRSVSSAMLRGDCALYS